MVSFYTFGNLQARWACSSDAKVHIQLKHMLGGKKTHSDLMSEQLQNHL